MSERFLSQAAVQVADRYGGQVGDLVCLLPGQAAAHSWLKALARTLGKVAWAPACYTVPGFWAALSGQPVQPGRPVLLAHLYAAARAAGLDWPAPEACWHMAGQLLDLFEQMEQWRVAPEELFARVEALGHPEDGPAGALPRLAGSWHAACSAIRRLHPTFVRQLEDSGQLYSGLLCRRLLARAEQGSLWPDRNPLTAEEAWRPPFGLPAAVLGIGLPGFTPLEEALFTQLSKQVEVRFYWDSLGPALPAIDPAGTFLRRYQQDPLFAGEQLTSSPPAPIPVQVTYATSQEHLLGLLAGRLEQLADKHGVEYLRQHAAILLGDARMVIPLLHILPGRLGAIHFLNGGLPVTAMAICTWLRAYLHYQTALASHPSGMASSILLERLQQLWSHPYTRQLALRDGVSLPEVESWLAASVAAACEKMAVRAPALYAFLGALPARPIWPLLKAQIELLGTQLAELTSLPDWEKAALAQLTDWLSEKEAQWRLTTAPAPLVLTPPLLRYCCQELDCLSVLLQPPGEEALRVTSLPGSLGHDFRELFIAGLNEGLLPTGPSLSAFLQESLAAAGKSALEEARGRQAYACHRLLRRADQVHAFCMQSDKSRGVGEPSRFVWQLRQQPCYQVTETAPPLPPPAAPCQPGEWRIEKESQVIRRLDRFWLEKAGPETVPLSPSSINLLLSCPRCFYLQHIEGIPPPPPRDPAPLLPGILFHAVMEQLYRPYTGAAMSPAVLEQLAGKAAGMTQRLFSEKLAAKGPVTRGDYKILQRVVAEAAREAIRRDSLAAPFVLEGVEYGSKSSPLCFPFTLQAGHTVLLKGKIDRIDRLQHGWRLVDYKTGSWQPRIRSVAALFTFDSRNDVAFQLLWYSWLWSQRCAATGQTGQITPAVMAVRQLFLPAYDPHFRLGEGEQKETLEDAAPLLPDFEASLRALLLGLWDPAWPFAVRQQEGGCPSGRYPRLCT